MSKNQLLQATLFSIVTLLVLAPTESSRATEIQVPVAPHGARTVLPAIDGAYRVGVRSFYWIDNTRSESGLAGNRGSREISVTAWYPAKTEPGQSPALYSPGIETILAAVDSVPEDRKQFILAHEPLLNVASNSVPGADLAPNKGGWPVIFFSPGGNVSRHFQTALAENVASRGFVFVAMSHPYSSLDVAPESGFSMSIEWGLDVEDRELANENDNRLAEILAADAAFVLDQLRAMARKGHTLAASMNLDSPGIAGHSRGGKTVGRSCSTHEVFQACLVIDNIGPARERITGIEQPFLTLRSDWGEDRVAELHDYLGRTGSVSHDVVLLQSNHFSCTDIPLFVSEVRVEGTEPVEAISACAKIVAGFFDTFLSGGDGENIDWMTEEILEFVTVRRFSAY